MKEKVVLTFHDYNGNITEETIWVVDLGNNKYKVDNIPFFAPNLSLGDIISVEKDQSNLYFEDLLETSGHSTIQLIFFNSDSNKNQLIIQELENIGCQWESMKGQPLYAIDISESIDYKIVKSILAIKAKHNILDYKEACLSKKHFAESK